ncbi:uncharacterized protein LOC110646141 isoform X2 [Hevea brasiliensis]|uniref:uncharacterized protein LOC110646141 isoform X2 n=1 Tax=Hevea brasiliensis TaxID=3981 RepID=UPI0025CC24BE|nr:uncharacterized protein LOC110646141 isoform X2 [Hevea brasiliensis]
MEEMNIDQVVDVPDTPDRLAARHINGAQSGKESNSSVAGPSRTDFRDKECLNQPGARSSENGHLNPQRIAGKMTGFEPHSKSVALSPSENSCPSKNAPLFGRGTMAYNSKPETRLSIGMQHTDKRKPESTKIPSRSRVHIEEEALFDMAFLCRASKTLQSEKTRDVQVSSNGGSNLHFAPTTSNNAFKGKEKIGVNAGNGFGLTINDGKGIDLTGGSQPKIEKQISSPHVSVISPKVTGRKRLVRNGCISPHNIATSAKKLADSHRVGSTNVGKDHCSSMVSDGPSEVDINDIVGEENNCYRAKGKGLVFHQSTSMEPNVKIGHASTSCGANSKAANETSDASRDALLGGWRGTRNRAKNICQIEGADGCFIDEQHGNRVLRRNSGNGNVTKIASDSGDQGEGQTASRPVSGLNQKSQSHHNIHSKRQKKHRLTSRNHSECSTMVPDDSEILFLGSSEASSSSRSSRTLNRQHQGILEPIYEIDELLPERRNHSSPGLGSMNDDSDSRARQVEADEILARELQEQLYHETPIFGGSEIDENIAWVLQQEEDAFRNASSQNHPRLRLRSSATMHANRQPQPQSFQNPSNRRRAQAQVPAARTSLRNRLLNRPPSALSRARNHSHTALSRASSFQFPLGMDLDMRLDILEALEDAVGEFSDMNMTASRILQVQRDFNENAKVQLFLLH